MTPLVRMIHAIATALLHPGELETVEESAQPGAVTEVAIRVQGKRAMGAVIGQAGETITAIRHLARRVGKVQKPAVHVKVEVKNREEPS